MNGCNAGDENSYLNASKLKSHTHLAGFVSETAAQVGFVRLDLFDCAMSGK